jgi:chromosome segregation ATPase
VQVQKSHASFWFINFYKNFGSMELVRENYAQLQASISELGSKVSGVLQKQETEFLIAYRTHMRNVQKDFETLRHDIDEKEKAIQNHVLVKHIEKERDWYKREALHLDQVLLKLKKREIILVEKVDELEQDRTWLSNQLKTVMKQKNLLECKLNCAADDVDDDEGEVNDYDDADVFNITSA